MKRSWRIGYALGSESLRIYSRNIPNTPESNLHQVLRSFCIVRFLKSDLASGHGVAQLRLVVDEGH